MAEQLPLRMIVADRLQGLSPPTGQRRVSRLMEGSRVATRIQLGQQAQLRGWVSR